MVTFAKESEVIPAQGHVERPSIWTNDLGVPHSLLNIHRDGSLYDTATNNMDYLTFKSHKTDSNLSEACRKCSILSDHLPAYAAGFGMNGYLT